MAPVPLNITGKLFGPSKVQREKRRQKMISVRDFSGTQKVDAYLLDIP